MSINYKLKLIIAFLVVFGMAYVCSSSKDDTKKEQTKEDTKKEDVKKEDTKREDTKREETKTDDTRTETTGSGRLYFCEEYRDGKEIGVADVFTISRRGGYLTVMAKLDKPINVGKVDLRISKKTGSTEKIIDTVPFDVQPNWDYIHFDEVTFKTAGTYVVTLMKSDGTPITSGEVDIKYE